MEVAPQASPDADGNREREQMRQTFAAEAAGRFQLRWQGEFRTRDLLLNKIKHEVCDMNFIKVYYPKSLKHSNLRVIDNLSMENFQRS